jgi:hypothetical protein
MSLEIPIPHLDEFLPLTDFAFGLAHLCIQKYNPLEWAKYISRYHGCVLDNSMYEMEDKPLSIKELVFAAQECQPSMTVAPDWMNDHERTVASFRELQKAIPGHDLAGVVQGEDLDDRIECFLNLQKYGCAMICFPFRTPRSATIRALASRNLLRYAERYHLLGLENVDELDIDKVFIGAWSYDTGKPFKGVRLDTVSSIRGLGRLDIQRHLDVPEVHMALWNVAYLRKMEETR